MKTIRIDDVDTFFFINEGLLFASVTPSPSTAGKNFMTLKI